MKWYLIVFLICVSLMTHNVECLFTYLFKPSSFTDAQPKGDKAKVFRFYCVGNREPMIVWEQKSDMIRNIKSGQKSVRWSLRTH